MPDALSSFRLHETPQSEQAHPDQVQNSGGGYVFSLSPVQRALRFLILGTDGGTYYADERAHTRENAKAIIDLANSDGLALVELIRTVSRENRAPRHNPSLFALAAAMSSTDTGTRRAAEGIFPEVVRTATHLFIFANYLENLRGWGKVAKRSVASWYTARPVDSLAYQLVKYRQRERRTHRSMLRVAHPVTHDPMRNALFAWAVGKASDVGHPLIHSFNAAQQATTSKEWVRLIEAHNLPWECLPDTALSEPAVWEALLPSMGLTALIRQLPRMTRIGLIAPLSDATRLATKRITDSEELAKARIHPFHPLVAGATYAAGHGWKGHTSWSPVPAITQALEDAFYLAFGNIEPSGKRTLVALDVSDSMDWAGGVAKSPLTAREVAAAMAMVTIRSEPWSHTVGFSHQLVDIPLRPSMSLSEVVATTSRIPMGGTDCSQPMLWAMEHNVKVDTFVVYTDNETWAGYIHPFEALQRYRDRTGIPARLVVVGMTSTGFTIANPSDPGMLDVVGFDAAAPRLISNFSAGNV